MIFRWMNGVTAEDRIRNRYVGEIIGVTSIVEKIRENRLKK